MLARLTGVAWQKAIHRMRGYSVFGWDDNKRRLNVLEYGIDFDDAKEVFDDPAALTFVFAVIGGREAIRNVSDL